jgi:hypothetical protein
MLFHVVEKCYPIGGVFTFLEANNALFLDPHASLPVSVPIKLLINVVDRNIIIWIKTFACIYPHVLVPAPVLAKRLFLL